MNDGGVFCYGSGRHFTKKSYGRTAGTPLKCSSHLEQDGALCYPKCRHGFNGVGPVCLVSCMTFVLCVDFVWCFDQVCWGSCPSSCVFFDSTSSKSGKKCTLNVQIRTNVVHSCAQKQQKCARTG